jgi:hypothetical protein
VRNGCYDGSDLWKLTYVHECWELAVVVDGLKHIRDMITMVIVQ